MIGEEYRMIYAETQLYEVAGNYNAAVEKIERMLGFFDLEIVPYDDVNKSQGVVIKIEVNGDPYYAQKEYPSSTKVKVYLDNN